MEANVSHSLNNSNL